MIQKRFFVSLLLLCIGFSAMGQKQKVWLDADTGNEVDDLYAIVRLVKEPLVELVGLSSAHFNNPDLNVFEKWNGYQTKGLNTVAESQRLNEQILKTLSRLDIPHPLGADRQIGRAWGQKEARPSPASEALITAVKKLPDGEKLDVLTLGALSNIASALILAPEILPKIKVYALGARYNPKTKVWDKDEFNIRNDLNAFNYMLNLNGLDFTIMPLEAARPLEFQREATFSQLNEKVEIENILKVRWQEHAIGDKARIMWDLALVEAYLKPELATIETVPTPPENSGSKVQVYTKIDERKLEEDFWQVLKK
ncbi:nucleoside hydrolase [Arundinibacter roseus]|uniref:Nucleoside hydrolase n=1 Tax=Arundinibacter roseus TaxID=2070510 RepID=A0A4R4KKH9_9BACT|nr:nucleoside hydrolase [Arundinibacter roseus]TDB67462.1 nucleoside hydrolase [Arundinibacter roseus]